MGLSETRVMPYDVVDLEELELSGPRETVRRVRQALGLRAFGMNVFDLYPPGEGHDEQLSGHEEVLFVLAGSGRLFVEGQSVDLRPGRFVRIDPGAPRRVVPGPDGLRVLVVGAPLDGSYAPPATR